MNISLFLRKNPLLFAVLAMLALTFVREVLFFPKMDLLPNPDSSWLLYAAGRLADGQKLYVDILETNPPFIVWFNLIPAWIGKFFGISSYTIFPYFMTFINILSLWLIISLLKKREFFSNSSLYYTISLYTAFGYFLLTPAIYGQRETIFIALVLPYLIKSLSPPDNDSKNHQFINFLITLMAAAGFAIKPFFMLLWGVNELTLAIRRRSLFSIFSLSNWFIGLFQLIYFISIYYLTPEYITNIMPVLLGSYFAYYSLWSTILKVVIPAVCIVMIIWFLASPHGGYKAIIRHSFFWVLACAGFMLLQRKEWINHAYPLVFMAGFSIILVLAYLIEVFKELGLDIGRGKFTAVCLAVSLLISVVYIDARFWYFMYTKPSVVSTKLLDKINEYADGKRVYPLSTSLQAGFPVIALSKGVFEGKFHHLWPLAGMIIREQQEKENSELINIRNFLVDNIVRDFSDNPPYLVWVDENVNMEKIAEYDIKPYNRNIIDLLSRDLRFAILWRDYKKIDEIEGEVSEDEKKQAEKEGKRVRSPERFSLYIRENK